MITGCLQEKNNTYYAVLYIKVDGKRKTKWIPTGLPVEGTSDRKAKKAFDQIRLEYVQEQEEIERKEAEERTRELIEGKQNPQAKVLFINYLQKWLLQSKPTLARSTFNGYKTMVDGRIKRYFTELDISLGEVTPQHIQDFHDSIFEDGYTPNTVIHYHAILRKALQNAVRKDIIKSNPADKVDRPKKNVYKAQFYSAEEIMELFDAVEGDPLEICVKLAAYYGLRRSEVLGLKWDAINLEQKTISIKHKVIEEAVFEFYALHDSSLMHLNPSHSRRGLFWLGHLLYFFSCPIGEQLCFQLSDKVTAVILAFFSVRKKSAKHLSAACRRTAAKTTLA